MATTGCKRYTANKIGTNVKRNAKEGVARAPAFPASDEASLITGAIVPIDAVLSAISIHDNSSLEL
ncbi:hypothetical protein LBMAG56_49090 [Verrucomicrobiota bacterium]|nr:hypothetical protein LBMAG56_49090 [Verrucomicrobiota bacterium]